MPPRLEFPLPKIQTHFGLIADPTIPLLVLTQKGFAPFDFLLDTGADATFLPRFMAKIIGIDLRRLPQERMFGIESKAGVKAARGEVTLRIREHTFSVPAFFSTSDASPLILGRAGFFDRFSVIFDNQRARILLEPLK